MVKLYGIKNCDSVQKALKWLTANQVSFQFIDFKQTPPSEQQIKDWLKTLDIFTLINKKSTSWRNLDESVKNSDDLAILIQAIMENPSLIKRPLLESGQACQVGFNASQWQQQLLG